MPEIPEMEVYKGFLKKYVCQTKIARVLVLREKSINLQKQEFKYSLEEETIIDIQRLGKQLVFELSNKKYLVLHLMLDGRIYYSQKNLDHKLYSSETDLNLKDNLPHLPGKPSIAFELMDNGVLYFCALTFGYLKLISNDELLKLSSQIGQNPLAQDFTELDWIALLKGKKGLLKTWLMDQRYISGIGNAYSNETLFAARLSPTRKIPSLTHKDKVIVYNRLREILLLAIKNGGDIEEPFMSNDNFSGGFNKFFNVYDREGEHCVNCNQVIIKMTIGGRNAFFCPYCQK